MRLIYFEDVNGIKCYINPEQVVGIYEDSVNILSNNDIYRPMKVTSIVLKDFPSLQVEASLEDVRSKLLFYI